MKGGFLEVVYIFSNHFHIFVSTFFIFPDLKVQIIDEFFYWPCVVDGIWHGLTFAKTSPSSNLAGLSTP